MCPPRSPDGFSPSLAGLPPSHVAVLCDALQLFKTLDFEQGWCNFENFLRGVAPGPPSTALAVLPFALDRDTLTAAL